VSIVIDSIHIVKYASMSNTEYMDGNSKPEQQLSVIQGESHEAYLERNYRQRANDLISGKISIEEYIQIEKVERLKLEHQATYDSLTELLNRRGFIDQFDDRIRQYERNLYEATEKAKSDPENTPQILPTTPGPLLMLDMIEFKKINDSMGHPFGDRVLKAVGKALGDLRPNDIAGRLGGDEFAVFIEGQTLEKGLEAAERIKNLISETIEQDEGFAAGVSIGLAMLPPRGGNFKDVLREADQALYYVKQSTNKNEVGYRRADGQFSIYTTPVQP